MLLVLPLLTAVGPVARVTAQQATFEGTVGDLSSKEPRVRLRAVQLLKGSAYPEAAVPLSAAITDPNDEVQIEAIAAELNIFLAERVTPKKRVGLLIEVRGSISAEPLFTAGQSVMGSARVPVEVPLALANAAIDANTRVAVEALYAFGSLAGEVTRADRVTVLRQSAPLLAGIMGVPDPILRIAAVRVVGRIFASRPGDGPLDETIGDAVISALNDREDPVRETAMWALGVMKYERSVQALSQLLQFYRKGPLAERAFDAIARIGHEASLPQFVELLGGKNLTFKLIAIEGIARVGDRRQFEAIQTMLKTEKNEALLLAGHFAGVLLADGAIDTLVESLTRAKLREQAFQYASELSPGRSAQFAAHLQNPDERVRTDLVDAIGLSGDPAAMAIVEPLSEDKSPEVALAARRALARLRASIPAS